MPVTIRLSQHLTDRLGLEAATELVRWFHQVDDTHRIEMKAFNDVTFSRFDATLARRLVEFNRKVELLLTKFERKIKLRLHAFERRIVAYIADLERKVELRFHGIEARMSGLEARMAELEVRMDKFEMRIERRMAAFEAKIEQRLIAFEAQLERRFAEQTRWFVGMWFTIVAASGMRRCVGVISSGHGSADGTHLRHTRQFGFLIEDLGRPCRLRFSPKFGGALLAVKLRSDQPIHVDQGPLTGERNSVNK